MFKRIGNLIKGFFGLFIGGIERKNPEALLEVEKENLRKQISEFNKGLATHAALVEKLISQTKRLDKEETELRAKTAANLKAGNRKLAGELALKLQTVDKEHDDMLAQLEGAETRYKELVKARDVSVKTAKKKIEELARNIDDMKVQKAMAELKMGSLLSVSHGSKEPAKLITLEYKAGKKGDAPIDNVKIIEPMPAVGGERR